MSVQLIDDADIAHVAAFIAFDGVKRGRNRYDREFAQGIAASLAEDFAAWNIRSMKARYPKDEWTDEEEAAHLEDCANEARKEVTRFEITNDCNAPGRLVLPILQQLSEAVDLIEYNCANARGFRDSNAARRLLEVRRPLLALTLRSINQWEEVA